MEQSNFLSITLINLNFMAFDLLFKFNLLILKFTIHFTHYSILTSLQCFNLYQFYSATIFVSNLSNRPIMSAASNSLSQFIDLQTYKVWKLGNKKFIDDADSFLNLSMRSLNEWREASQSSKFVLTRWGEKSPGKRKGLFSQLLLQ